MTKKQGKIKSQHSIGFRLIGAFLIPVALIIILGAVCFTQASKNLKANYEDSSKLSIRMMAEYFDLGLINISNKAFDLISDDDVQKYYSKYYQDKQTKELESADNSRKKILAIATADKFISDIYVIANYGNPVSSTGTLKTDFYDKLSQSDEIKKLNESGEANIWIGSHPYLDEATKVNTEGYALSYIKKLTNAGLKQIGYIIIDINQAFIKDIIEESDFGESSFTGFITQDGKIILNKELPYDFDLMHTSYYEKALADENATGAEYVEFQNEKYLFVYSKLAESNSMVFSFIANSEVVKQVQDIKIITVAIVIAACFIAIFIGFFMARGIGNAIKETNKALAVAATGDLRAKVNTKRKDEFSILARSINHMFDSMKTMVTNMFGASEKTLTLAKNVTDASQALVTSSKSIANAVTDIEQGVASQASDAENCLHTMSELADLITMVEDNAVSIQKVAEISKEAVTDGQNAMLELKERYTDSALITKEVIENIGFLSQESQSITDIIQAIKDIADQTRLLSLNASIEAARAGIYGKGFSVLAEEIRRLSEQSTNEVERITTIIQGIIERTSQTVVVAEKVESIVDKQESTLNHTQEVFEKIHSHVVGLTSNLDEIIGSIDKISKAKNETLHAIESISSTLEETAAASMELGHTAEQQYDVANELNKTAESLKEEAESMEAEVKNFRTEDM